MMRIVRLLLWLSLWTILPSVEAIARHHASDIIPDYFVLFSDEETGPDTYRCSGVLVHPDIVLTSAQCAEGPYDYIRIGYKNDDTSYKIVRSIGYTWPPGWHRNHQTPVHDMALVFLDQEIHTIPFPIINSNRYSVQPDETYQVLGAGAYLEHNGMASKVFSDRVTIQHFKTCAKNYREEDARIVLDAKGSYCAGSLFNYTEAGPCSEGDAGSPMIYTNEEGKDVVVGVASFGSCAKGALPFVYSRTSTKVSWLQKSICRYSNIIDDNYCAELLATPFPSSAPSSAPTRIDYSNFFSILSDSSHGSGTVRCGASLIHDDVLLTAQGCATEDLIARVGYLHDNFSIAVRNITKVVEYSPTIPPQENYPNDVALVFLSSPVLGVSQTTINSIMAFPPDNGKDELMIRHAGSETDTFANFELARSRQTIIQTSLTDQLQIVNMATTVNFLHCAQDYRAEFPYYVAALEEKLQFCVDTYPHLCDTGAWGSPLYQEQDDGSILQVGIASQGSCSSSAGTNSSSLPFIFTRVANYADWIHKTVCEYSETMKCEDQTRKRALRHDGEKSF